MAWWRPQPRGLCVRLRPSPLPQRGTGPPFSAHISVAAKWLHESTCNLVWSYRPQPRLLCVRWGPHFSLPKGGGGPKKFGTEVGLRLSIHALVAKIWHDKVVRWCRNSDFLRPVFAASRVQRISDLHSKFALRPHHVPKYGKHPISNH